MQRTDLFSHVNGFFKNKAERAVDKDSIYPGIKGAWRLRSPGENEKRAAIIDFYGSIMTYGFNVDSSSCCVRPHY